MNTSLRAYLDAIRQFPKLARQSPQQYFRRPGKDFTRTRILHLERVAWLNITLLKSTLCVELDRFFDWLNTGEFSPTKSALSKPAKSSCLNSLRTCLCLACACSTNASKPSAGRACAFGLPTAPVSGSLTRSGLAKSSAGTATSTTGCFPAAC